MHPIEHPETVLLIHNEQLRREMRRGRQHIGRDDVPRPRDRGGPGPRLRRAFSIGLVRLASWIAPTDGGRRLPAGTTNH